MTYANRSLERIHTVKLSFNDEEAELVNALVRYTGEQKAAFIRQLVLERAAEVFHGGESVSVSQGMQRTEMARFAA